MDEFGFKIARVTFSYGDNDKALIRHAMQSMRDCLAAGGTCDLWDEEDDTGVNPSLTIRAIACRTADRIRAPAASGEL